MADTSGHLASEPVPFAFTVTDGDSAAVEMVARAIEAQRVRLAFQPVVHARDPSRISFYEGLIRVLDARGDPIPARAFIREIERHEVGRMIDCLALGLGLKALEGDPTMRLSINMSARSIGYPPWLAVLDEALAPAPELGHRLILEITEESAIVMPGVVRAFTNELRERGIAFALDDFGSGYTSFRYLKTFSFDILKIDGQFVQGIHNDPDNQVLLKALVDIGRHFDMLTVAESVETAREAAFLSAIGVDCLQGYHFGRPELVPVKDLGAPGRSAAPLRLTAAAGVAAGPSRPALRAVALPSPVD